MERENWCFIFAHECVQCNCTACLEYLQLLDEQKRENERSEGIHKEQGLYDGLYDEST